MVLKDNVVSITKNPHVSGSLHNNNIFNMLGYPSSICTVDMNYTSKQLTRKKFITSIFIVTNPVNLPTPLTENNLPNLALFSPYNTLEIKPDTFMKSLVVDLNTQIVQQSKSYVLIDMKYVTKESRQVYIPAYEPLSLYNQYNVTEITLQNMSTLQSILNLFKQYNMLEIFKTFYMFFNNMTIKVSHVSDKDNTFNNVLLQLHNTKTNDDLYVHIHNDQVFVNNHPLSTYEKSDIK